MRCVVCGTDMHLLRIAADKTMMVPVMSITRLSAPLAVKQGTD
jgi:hypothetical protein